MKARITARVSSYLGWIAGEIQFKSDRGPQQIRVKDR